MSELLFECYSVPSLTYGIDSLFSYKFNRGRSGLIISSSHSSTHVVPVLNSKAVMSNVSRLNWGGFQGVEYLLKLLKLKYPHFPGKLTCYQAEHMIHEHCYVSQNFDVEMRNFLDWPDLEVRDHVVQFPFTEHVVVEKSEEELARIAERKKEGGRRLQEQAARTRLEKLIQKEQELEYYKDLHKRLEGQTKKETKRLLDEDELKDEAQLDKIIKDMERSVRKARNKDLGVSDHTEQEEVATFPLLNVPDEELDDIGLKQKRHQRLLKSGVEARARAKLEKEQERVRITEEQRLDDERRLNDNDAWLHDRRAARTVGSFDAERAIDADTFSFKALLQKIKDRERQKADLSNRKSLASQMRMKTLANLASDAPGRKRRRGGDDDNFGANDEDWGVYRTVAIGEQSDDEEEEDLDAKMRHVEAQLLEYDPDFNESNTMAAQMDWTKSLMHAFVHGPQPFDRENPRDINQLHLNVERIRVPEVVFQPAIAGLDQAGIVDIAADMINHGLDKVQYRNSILQDIFVTGGYTLFSGFEERLRKELRAVLPIEATMRLRQAGNPLLDPWRGAAQWSKEPDFRQNLLTRDEYHEKGLEYMKVREPLPMYTTTFTSDSNLLTLCVRSMIGETPKFIKECFLCKVLQPLCQIQRTKHGNVDSGPVPLASYIDLLLA